VIELPIYWWIGRNHTRGWRILLGGGGGTLISHPFLWFLWVRLFANYWTYTISGELLVTAFEGFFFWFVAKPIPLKWALWASVLANATSCLVGFAVF
jgi:hypothetical protein